MDGIINLDCKPDSDSELHALIHDARIVLYNRRTIDEAPLDVLLGASVCATGEPGSTGVSVGDGRLGTRADEESRALEFVTADA